MTKKLKNNKKEKKAIIKQKYKGITKEDIKKVMQNPWVKNLLEKLKDL